MLEGYINTVKYQRDFWEPVHLNDSETQKEYLICQDSAENNHKLNVHITHTIEGKQFINFNP